MPRTISAGCKSVPSVGPRKIMASMAARKSAPSTGRPTKRVLPLASKSARKSAPSQVPTKTAARKSAMSSSSYTRQDESTDEGTSSFSSDEGFPTSLKRSRSPVEDRPNKIARLSGPEYVKDLEKQIEDLHAFIIRKNLVLETPASIRKHIEAKSGAAKALYDSIKTSICKACDQFFDEDTYGTEKGISGDDYSEAVEPFIDDIDKLSDMPRGLELAFELVLYLGTKSQGELVDGCCECGSGDRPSDEPADELLCLLAKRMKANVEGWNPVKELERLRQEAKSLEGFGIDSYFPRSMIRLAKYVNGD